MRSDAMNQHLQDSILRLSITDTEFLRLARPQLEPELFTSSLAADIALLCTGFYDTNNAAPGDHLHDELVRYIKDRPERDKKAIARYVRKLQEMHHPNRPYVLKRLATFARARKREESLVLAAELVEQGRLDEADNLLYNMLRDAMPEENTGIDALKDMSRLWLPEEDAPIMPTGLKPLDMAVGGWRRGQLIVMLGGYKGGKTWWLTHQGKTALLQGLSVLHISHEVSQAEQLCRYDMMFSWRGTQEHVGQIAKFRRLDRNKGKLQRCRLPIRTVRDPQAIEAGLRRMSRFGGSLRVVKYPQGRCTPAQIEQLMNHLEHYEGFIPDILLIDYIDVMDLTFSGKTELRHQLNDAYIWAKGLADDRQIVVQTVSQVQRQALDKTRITRAHVSEDARKVGNCDIMLAMGRSPDENAGDLAGMNVIASRVGGQNAWCELSPCFDLGQFAVDAWWPTEVKDREFDEDSEKWSGE